MTRQLVDDNIESDEICIRCIFHPNAWAQSEASIMTYENNKLYKNGITAQIVYAPMNGDQYVDISQPVYTDSDISLPMHADLEYNVQNNSDVKTRMRQYARKLAKKAVYPV